MKVIKTNDTIHLYRDDVETYDRIPVGTYTICFAKNVGFYLTTRNDMVVDEKIYGCHPEKARKVLAAFRGFQRSLGVIMSGAKGIGKSVSAKLIAAKALADGMPVIICDQYIPGIASFIESIEQEVMILFDEFDKAFAKTEDENPQASMLSLFDGTAVGKKLYVVTCNYLFDKGSRVRTWMRRDGSGRGCYVGFCVGDVQFDLASGKLSVAKDRIVVDNPYDDDDDEREDRLRWEKEMHPECLMVYRNRAKSLHYLL